MAKEGSLLLTLMEEICQKSAVDVTLDPVLLQKAESAVEHISSDKSQQLAQLRQCHETCEQRHQFDGNHEIFEMVEEFVHASHKEGRARRLRTSKVAASEERSLAAEVAALKSIRSSNLAVVRERKLDQKISDTERSYLSKNLMAAKAAQIASAECRLQFARNRSFMEVLHKRRLDDLHSQHKSSMFLRMVTNHVEGKNARACALEEHNELRIYEKKKSDANEHHMAQNLEEAQYMEAVLGLLDKVQAGKEEAARCLLGLQISHLKEEAVTFEEQRNELDLFYAASRLEIAKVAASNLVENQEEEEVETARHVLVDKLERRKAFFDFGSVLSVGQLYDEALWIVASSTMGLPSSASDSYSDLSSAFDEAEFPDDEEQCQPRASNSDPTSHSSSSRRAQIGYGSDDVDSTCNESAAGLGENKGHRSPVQEMQMKQLKKEIDAKEKALLKKHTTERRREKHSHRKSIRALKQKQQSLINGLLENCLAERQMLRQGIKKRLDELVRRQASTTASLVEAIANEGKRLEDAKEECFADAKTLISEQTFHEVRNALSSVIAMSEMTRSLNEDKAASSELRFASVDDMMQQLNEVVSYATNILNNVLDLSKIKSDSMILKKKDIDLQDIVARATKMQISRAKDIKMAFVPSSTPYIANSDQDVVARILTNFISNAVKFTKEGAIQPFVGPLELLLPNFKVTNSHLDLNGKAAKMAAIGVADTGSGLRQDILDDAMAGVLESVSGGGEHHGACNSGFGLHLCQMLAKSLGSEIYLGSIDDAWPILSEDMKHAATFQKNKLRYGTTHASTAPIGSVLYFTLPVYRDVSEAQEKLKAATEADRQQRQKNCSVDRPGEFVFRPRPSPSSTDGSFRILIADDVLMLRKGLLNTLCTVVTDCPVSISTASTAEDMLRAAAADPFDLIICDNLFHHENTEMKTLSRQEEDDHGRPRLFVDLRTTSRSDLRTMIADFFQNERFSWREGDGALLGVKAMMQLLQAKDNSFPTPIMMLLSGHTIEVPESMGLIVAQKPLKLTDFCTVIESAAPLLVRTNHCSESFEVDSGTESDVCSAQNILGGSVVKVHNRHGAQIFERVVHR